jgi:N-methylhydantoinase B
MDVALNAAEVGVQTLRLALAASPEHPARAHLAGWGASSALGLHTWACAGIDGSPDAFIMLDGNWVGSSAGSGCDGMALSGNIVGPESDYSFTDVEILESWYPILISEKSSRTGTGGAGRFRAGGGNNMGFSPHGTDRLVGAMLGMRRWLPLEGAAGGMPGACTRFLIRRADGSVDEVATHASGVTIEPGDTFEFHCANGGGFGDPLDRERASVHEDILLGRLTRAEAEETYGLRFDAHGQPDAAASSARRAEMLADRLARATPARTGAEATSVAPAASGTAPRLPLYVGVVNEGGTAIAEDSGAVLARSPAHWTDGCPVLIDVRPEGGPEVHVRSYLDPKTGKILYAEVALASEARGFDSSPLHWTNAASRT